jgi:zinc transporter ZupT
MPAFIVLGYLLVFLIEQLFNVHLHKLPEEGNSSSEIPVAAGIASFIAFNVHDFIDGIAMGAGMVTDVSLGVVIFLAVLFHEVPVGFVIAAIMRGAGWSRRAAIMSGLSLGLITLVGIALPFQLGEINPFVADALLALAAGTFIYLGATLLVPLSEAGKSRAIPFLVVLGFVVFVISNWLVGQFIAQ